MSPTRKRGYLYLGDDDDEEIKVIPIKKHIKDCCDKEQQATEDNQNSSGLLFRFSERSTTMQHLQCVHDVSSIP